MQINKHMKFEILWKLKIYTSLNLLIVITAAASTTSNKFSYKKYLY